jgi:hypothetical protein
MLAQGPPVPADRLPATFPLTFCFSHPRQLRMNAVDRFLALFEGFFVRHFNRLAFARSYAS